MKLARVGQHWDSLHGYVDDTPTSIPDQLTKDEELQRKLQENIWSLEKKNLEKVIFFKLLFLFCFYVFKRQNY